MLRTAYSIPNIQGWERYPENLTYSGCDAYRYNLSSYNAQVTSDAKRLFTPENEEIAVKVIEFDNGVHDKIIHDANELEQYLKTMNSKPIARMILIPQQGSWGRLVIDEKSFRKLLTALEVFPPFIDIFRSFGEKTGYEDDSFGGFSRRDDDQNNLHETTYLVKHVEEHGRSDLDDPWSIRQMGVYHRAGSDFGNTFVVVNPSFPFRQRLKAVKAAQKVPSAGQIHMMVLSCIMEQWRWYISDVEKRYLSMKDKAQLSHLDGRSGKELNMTDIQFEDTQEIQVLQDKSQQLAHLFGMDRTILREMQSRLPKIGVVSGAQGPVEDDFMSSMVIEADMQMSRIENLLKRLEGTIALVRTVLDFRCLASMEKNSGTMTQISHLTQAENKLMVKQMKSSARDTEIMKILTILALVYLPASFVSSLMGMGYINVDQAPKRMSIHFAGEFWIFLVLTIILLITTLLFYGSWIRQSRSRRTAREDEEMMGI